jgi:hypothetical protein
MDNEGLRIMCSWLGPPELYSDDPLSSALVSPFNLAARGIGLMDFPNGQNVSPPDHPY